jgi:hypothetical protein
MLHYAAFCCIQDLREVLANIYVQQNEALVLGLLLTTVQCNQIRRASALPGLPWIPHWL